METISVIMNRSKVSEGMNLYPCGFKKRLEVFRKSLNVSQESFALSVGLSVESYKQIKDNPTLQMILKFTKQYSNLSYAWLLDGEGDMLKTSSSDIVNTSNIHSQRAHNISNGSGNINETPASSGEIVELLKQQNATLTQQVASLTELLKSLTNK